VTGNATRRVAAFILFLTALIQVQCASLNQCEPERGLSPLRRAGKDLTVLVTSPATLVTKSLQETSYTFDDGEVLYFTATPLTFTFAAARNVYWTAFHAVDLVFYPFYSFSRATPLATYDIEKFPYQYLTPRTFHGQHVYPPDNLILPFYFLTAGTGYFLDPYAWKFAEHWPGVHF